MLSQGSKRVVKLIVRQAVALGAHQQKLAIRGGKKVQQLPVGLLRRNVHVDQRDTQCQRGSLVQIRLDKLRPLLRILARNLGVSVAGQSAKMTSGRGLPGNRISKKLMLRVRPGVELVRASLVPTRELMTLDLPTLERPRKAISGTDATGKWAASVAAAMNRDKTLMLKFATARARLARDGWLVRTSRLT